jgi:hypothetical protein
MQRKAKVPIGSGITVYDRIGDTFGWLALALGIALSAFALRPKRMEETDELDETQNSPATRPPGLGVVAMSPIDFSVMSR